jgi:hypothetical protein
MLASKHTCLIVAPYCRLDGLEVKRFPEKTNSPSESCATGSRRCAFAQVKHFGRPIFVGVPRDIFAVAHGKFDDGLDLFQRLPTNRRALRFG